MASKPDYTYEPGQRQVTKRHADVIVEHLPDRGESFYRDSLPEEEWLRDAVDDLVRAGCLDIEEVVNRHGSPVNRWVVPERTQQLAAYVVETRDAMLPCGHRGLRNRDGYLECRFDGCDERYIREEVTDDV